MAATVRGGFRSSGAGASRWWRRASLTTKTIVVFALTLGPITVSILVLGVLNERDARLDAEIFEHREFRTHAAQVLKLVVDADTSIRGFLLTGDDSFLEPYRNAESQLPKLFARMEHRPLTTHPGQSTSDDPELQDLAEQQMAVLAELRDSGYTRSELRHEKRLMDGFRAAMGRLMEEEDAQIYRLASERDTTTTLARVVLVAGGSISLLGALLGALVLMRGVVSRIRTVTEYAGRLASGEEFDPWDDGSDEISQLAIRLTQSARLLRSRESDLRLAKLEAENANIAKSQFLSRMSHELRTPLNAILGFADVARSEAEGVLARDLDQIHLAGRHLLALINEVLDISKIEAGELSLSVEPVSVREVVDEAISLVSGAATSRSIQVRSGIRCETSIYALVDRQRLKQVLVNLLSNAVKYNRDGGEVRITCLQTGTLLRLAVADTGPGLPAGSVEEVFKPFARLGAETTDIEGTGLGLALSKSLMQAMGGDIEVGSTGPTGTEFWVHLQASQAPASLATTADHEPPMTDIGIRPLRGTVLQVEDNPSNVRLVARIMQRRPEVTLVSTHFGLQAIALAKKLRPDVILLDLNLPDISGHEVLVRLRSDPETRDLRIVMLSADATDAQITTLLESGAHEYLTKPIDVRALLATVDEAVSLREAG